MKTLVSITCVVILAIIFWPIVSTLAILLLGLVMEFWFVFAIIFGLLFAVGIAQGISEQNGAEKKEDEYARLRAAGRNPGEFKN